TEDKDLNVYPDAENHLASAIDYSQVPSSSSSVSSAGATDSNNDYDKSKATDENAVPLGINSKNQKAIHTEPQPQTAGSIPIVSSHQEAPGNTKNNKLINMSLCQDPKAPKNKQAALDAHSSSALYSSNHSKDGALCKAHDNSLLQAQKSNYAASQTWSSAASTSSAKDSENHDIQGSVNAHNKGKR
ncbi:hypothetical protein, partial, partial [Parasitella parasitica]